jgi:hypothetical protein
VVAIGEGKIQISVLSPIQSVQVNHDVGHLIGRILFALDALDRRKPQEREQRSATTAHRFGLNMDSPTTVPERALSSMTVDRKNRVQRTRRYVASANMNFLDHSELVNAESLERELQRMCAAAAWNEFAIELANAMSSVDGDSRLNTMRPPGPRSMLADCLAFNISP